MKNQLSSFEYWALPFFIHTGMNYEPKGRLDIFTDRHQQSILFCVCVRVCVCVGGGGGSEFQTLVF